MDINQVRFGNYSIGNPNGGAKKSEAKAQENPQPQVAAEGTQKEFNVDNMFNAMNIAGTQNKANINFTAKKEFDINDISKYVDVDSQARIESMMAGFDAGVTAAANTIDAEFPGLFADADKYALAAHVAAQE